MSDIGSSGADLGDEETDILVTYIENNKHVLTKYEKKLVSHIDILKKKRTKFVIDFAQKFFEDQYQRKFTSIDQRVDILLTRTDLAEAASENEAEVKKWKKFSEEINATYTKLLNEMQEIMDPIPGALPAAPLDNDGAGGIFGRVDDRRGIKAADYVKPDTLQKSASPAMKNVWILGMKTYFRQSGFLKLPAEDQRIVFENCMSNDLKVTFQTRFTTGWRIFGEKRGEADDTFENLVNAYWLEIHPLMGRRLELLRGKQSHNQKYSQYLNWIQRTALVCDLANLTEQDYIVLIALKGCVDEELLRELLKIKNPDTAKLESVALEYERRQKDVTALGKAAGLAGATSTFRNQQRQQGRNNTNGNRPQGNNNSSGANNTSNNTSNGQSRRQKRTLPEKFKGKCLFCGSEKHKSEGCDPEKKAKLNCTHCNIKGKHSTHMCLKKHFEDAKKAEASASLVMMAGDTELEPEAPLDDILTPELMERNIALSLAELTIEEAGGADVECDPLPLMAVKLTPTDK